MFVAAYAWFWMALGSAAAWGLAYALIGKILKEGFTTPFFLFVFSTFQVLLLGTYLLMKKVNIVADFSALLSKPAILCMLIVSAFSIFAGNLLIFTSIQQKNAVVSSLIEIAYPLFTIIFAYLLFREAHLNLYTTLGGVLIFAGVCFIFLKG